MKLKFILRNDQKVIAVNSQMSWSQKIATYHLSCTSPELLSRLDFKNIFFLFCNLPKLNIDIDWNLFLLLFLMWQEINEIKVYLLITRIIFQHPRHGKFRKKILNFQLYDCKCILCQLSTHKAQLLFWLIFMALTCPTLSSKEVARCR